MGTRILLVFSAIPPIFFEKFAENRDFPEIISENAVFQRRFKFCIDYWAVAKLGGQKEAEKLRGFMLLE
ncbi:unnamed protein product [Caenorhabditis angaria]|uniref:Uncharacterized protein n=1 Tax=Caenorhabditis angaria TaxID=860376 RepID=A0A9P1IDY8_9PELO|nr:unnamed protein product [Caenorhabditis angaria]